MYVVFIACQVELSQVTRVSVVVGLRSISCVTSIVQVQLLPIVCCFNTRLKKLLKKKKNPIELVNFITTATHLLQTNLCIFLKSKTHTETQTDRDRQADILHTLPQSSLILIFLKKKINKYETNWRHDYQTRQLELNFPSRRRVNAYIHECT